MLNIIFLKVLCSLSVLFYMLLTDWFFWYSIKIKIQFFPCSKVFNGSLSPTKNFKLLNLTPLTNLTIIKFQFSSVPILYNIQTEEFLWIASGCFISEWTTPPFCLECHSLYPHLDPILFLLGCLPTLGIWRTRRVLVISHREEVLAASSPSPFLLYLFAEASFLWQQSINFWRTEIPFPIFRTHNFSELYLGCL